MTPANLSAFDNHFTDYFSVGCSAMVKNAECAMLRGRLFVGVITLVNSKLRKHTKIVKCDERYVIIKIGNLVLINVYFPCSGTKDRVVLCEEMLAEISSWCESFYRPMCQYVIAGDFNCNLDTNDSIAERGTQFIHKWSLERCDNLLPNEMTYTYINFALNQQSYINYTCVIIFMCK